MNKFNKLYNLILLSIITEDINSKIKKAIMTLIQSGQLTSEDDPRALLVKTIIKRNNSIDINGKTKLDLLLKQNETLINREESKKDDYLDSISLFYNKQTYPDGVVIYNVKETKEGQAAVRRVVDDMWGEDANPWCLITRKNSNSWDMWKHYKRFPKQIAFQNGKLLAFRASDKKNDLWWNRLDLASKKLKPLKGKSIEVPEPEWTESELKDKQKSYVEELKNHFVYNEKTGRWDTKGKDQGITITNDLIVDGDFPFPMGVIRGYFSLYNCTNLTSFKNGPTKITGEFYFDKSSLFIKNSLIYKNYILQTPQRFIERYNLKLNPKTKRYDSEGNVWVDRAYIINNQFPVPFGVINGNFNCIECNNLKYTNYLPTKVTGTLDIIRSGTRTGNMIRKTLFYKNYIKLTPLRFIKHFNLVYNEKTKMYDYNGERMMIEPWDLPEWDHIPVKLGVIKGDCIIERCRELKSLLNCPEIVKGNFNVMYNGQLNDLRGFPKHVTGRVQLNDLFVNELKGMLNSIIDGNLDIRGLAYLQSLDNFPKLNGSLLITGYQWRNENIRNYITEYHIDYGND